MISRREFEESILDYSDNALSKSQARKLEWHLRQCGDCRGYLAAYERAVEAGQAALSPEDDTMPEEVPEHLVKAVLDALDADADQKKS